MWECQKFSVLARVTNYIYQCSYDYSGSVTRKLDLFCASVWLVCNHVIEMTPRVSRKGAGRQHWEWEVCISQVLGVVLLSFQHNSSWFSWRIMPVVVYCHRYSILIVMSEHVRLTATQQNRFNCSLRKSNAFFHGADPISAGHYLICHCILSQV